MIVLPRSENRRADAHVGGAELDGDREVGAHAHRQTFQPVTLGDPRVALAWLANELRELGVTLRAGEVVTTGTCHPPLPIQSGDVFEADFGVIGKVSVAFD